MNFTKSILRRVLGGLFALALVAVSFPMAAFALQPNVDAVKYQFAEDGTPLDIASGKLKGNVPATQWKVNSDNTIDLWIYSEDMTSEEQHSGSTVPYVIDEAGQKWVLKEIDISNDQKPGGNGDKAILMTSEQIENAKSLQDYVVSTSEINVAPYVFYPESVNYPCYFVWYIWKADKPIEGLKQYKVSYDLNFPENATTLFGVWNNGGLDAAESNGVLGTVESELKNLAGTAYSSQPYTVSDFQQYGDFIAFTHDTDYGHDYYDFDGWTVKGQESGTVYRIGDVIDGDQLASLADADGNITFVAKWTPIEPWDDDDLKAASEALTVNAVTKIDNETPLITQSVNGADATGNTVTLKADDTISYTVQTRLGGNLGANTNPNGITPSGDFATFTYQVKVDKNLEFVDTDQDGKVTLTLDSDNFVLKETNIPEAVISEDKKTITFDPSNVIKAEDGRMDITVTMQYLNGQKLASTDPIILSGLDFKLKDSAVNNDTTISTYANVTGSINLYEKSPISWRFFYQSVSSFLSQADWHQYFGLDADWHNYPAAVAHASQFIDYKLKNFDLSTDPTATLEDNTCTATFEKPTYGIRVFAYDKATEKEDGSATGLANAAFALYDSNAVTEADGSVTIKPGAVALQSGKTEADGSLTFDSLDEGTYYLFETQAPAGYARNAQPWKIVVAKDAVDADNMVNVEIAYTLIPQTTEPDDDKPGEHQPSSTQGSGSVSDNTSGNASGSTQNTETTQTQTTGSTAAGASAASAIPQTSDESNPVLWTVLFLASGMTLAGITLCRRKTARHRS